MFGNPTALVSTRLESNHARSAPSGMRPSTVGGYDRGEAVNDRKLVTVVGSCDGSTGSPQDNARRTRPAVRATRRAAQARDCTMGHGSGGDNECVLQPPSVPGRWRIVSDGSAGPVWRPTITVLVQRKCDSGVIG